MQHVFYKKPWNPLKMKPYCHCSKAYFSRILSDESMEIQVERETRRRRWRRRKLPEARGIQSLREEGGCCCWWWTGKGAESWRKVDEKEDAAIACGRNNDVVCSLVFSSNSKEKRMEWDPSCFCVCGEGFFFFFLWVGGKQCFFDIGDRVWGVVSSIPQRDLYVYPTLICISLLLLFEHIAYDVWVLCYLLSLCSNSSIRIPFLLELFVFVDGT